MIVNILAVGDVVGKPGLLILERRLRSIQKIKEISFTVVNGENASGIGITQEQAESIFSAGADVITLGNHTWGKPGIGDYIDDCRYILRPANYAPQVPGRGCGVYDAPFGKVRVINLIGRCNMDYGPDNPFLEAEKLLREEDDIVTLVDMHAEATSEKLAMGYHLDGRVSAVWGTHTHVQTSDGSVLPKGTGYITDIGMTGPKYSVIGVKPSQSVSMFRGDVKGRFEVAEGDVKLECAVFTIDTETRQCRGVEALRIED